MKKINVEVYAGLKQSFNTNNAVEKYKLELSNMALSYDELLTYTASMCAELELRDLTIKTMDKLAILNEEVIDKIRLLNDNKNYTLAVERLLNANEKLHKGELKLAVISGAIEQKTIYARKNGKARAAKDIRSQMLKKIEEVDYPTKKHLFHIRGHRVKFINDMFIKYPVFVDKTSIERRVDKLNKDNGISQKKK